MNHVTTGGHLKTNPCNLNASHLRFNDSRIRRFERFLEKNKLDNALVVTGSGEVVDLYSEAVWNRRMGFMALIWMRTCRRLSKSFSCLGNFFFKASSFPFRL